MKPGAIIAVLALVVTGLAAADQFLARVESAEIRKTAERSYVSGSRLLESGKALEAIDFLREAHALERQNPTYELQLIAALTAAGKTNDAEPLLTDSLQREPNDGRANLVAARLMVRKGNTPDAEAYYHRAIYGQWSGDAPSRQVAVRLELVDFLAAKNRNQELLAELISLQAEAPPDPAIQQRLGALFLRAGSPARAADLYRGLAAKDPGDMAAWEGLGEAELEAGEYRAAREAFLRASQRDVGNQSVRARLQTLSTVTGLDPTSRQLTSAEKYRRSIRILEMARAALDECAAGLPENRSLMEAADVAISSRTPAHVTNESAEDVLSLAENLWRAGNRACGGGFPKGKDSDRNNTLALIMKKLAG